MQTDSRFLYKAGRKTSVDNSCLGRAFTVMAFVIMFLWFPAESYSAGFKYSQFQHRLPSKYFIFYSNIPQPKLAAYAELSDLFVEYVDRHYFKTENRFPIRVVVLPDRVSFKELLLTQLQMAESPEYGIYLGDMNLFITHDEAGIGTFTHEIAHPLVEVSLKNRPQWAIEGIPAFFEKFYGYKKEGRLYAVFGYQNPWRVADLGERLTTLNLEEILASSESTSEKRLVSVFLYQAGKWETFLDMVKKGDKRGYATYVEAAFNKPLKDMEPDWRQYLQNIQLNRGTILRLPNSVIFDTEKDYLRFKSRLGLHDNLLLR
jgi:hypothetical protein